MELITELIRRRRLFQEAKTNNALFPIYDGGAIVGAEVVGTMPGKRFKGIKNGSKYGCGYNLSFGDKTAFALFFESSIDLLSFVDLAHMRGKDLAGCRLTSMMGLKQNIVDRTMQEWLPRRGGPGAQRGMHFPLQLNMVTKFGALMVDTPQLRGFSLCPEKNT